MTHPLFESSAGIPERCPRCLSPATPAMQWIFIGNDAAGEFVYICSQCAGKMAGGDTSIQAGSRDLPD
jgi:hypothetical protein